MTYILYFLAGLFAANGVPHFVKGITGERHMTPFGKPSSAFVNVLWGTVNFYFSAWLMHFATIRPHSFAIETICILIGVLVMSSMLSLVWAHDEKAKGH